MNTQSRFCSTCQKVTAHKKDAISAAQMILHIFLSLITCGLWLFILGIMLLAENLQPYKCTFCGTTNPKGTAPRP